MSTELLYTSAPRGLRHGSRGFCTVLTTAGMPINVIARLEAISSYRHLFPPDGNRAAENPVSLAHQRLNLGGQVVSVVSRIAAYGTDYSGRTNKIAHHVTIDPSEMPAAGPAWLIRQRSVLRTDWLGQCETPATGPEIPRGDQPPRICSAWKSIAGDAGWGGVVAEAILQGDAQPLWVIYPLSYEKQLLELIDESISLLPVAQRWRATFNTFAANIPPDVECKVRFVPEGTDEAKFAASGGKAINLTKHQSITTASQWVERARGAFRIEAGITSPTSGFTAVQDEEGVAPVESAWSSDDDTPPGPPPPTGPPELPPELISRPQKRRQLAIAAVVLAAVVGLGATWTVARLMAGLPVLPGSAPPPVPQMPIDITPPIDEKKPVVAPAPVPVEALELTLHYDKKQILAWASGDPDMETPLPKPVSLRGYVRLDMSKAEDSKGSTDAKTAAKKAKTPSRDIAATKLISWGDDAQPPGEPEELLVQATTLTAGAQPMTVERLPYSPQALGPTTLYWNRETGDLIAIADLDFSDDTDFLADQRDAYRSYAVNVSAIARLAGSIESESEQLPQVLKDATNSFVRRLFPGRGESRISSLIRRGSGVDLSEEATKLGESLQEKAKTTKLPEKEQLAALVSVVSDCVHLAQASTELRRAIAVLEKGQSVKVPELKFLESEKVTLRRVPLQIHFSW